MTPSRPIAPCAAVLAASDEAAARTALAALLEPAGVEVVRSGFEPPRRIGDHARIWFWWRLPAGAPADHRARMEAFARGLVEPADRAKIVVRAEETAGEGLELEIIVAANVVRIAAPGLVWLHLELDLEAAVQADLEAALTS
jgi:hypothetical protein